jgi:hypothetical protein
MLFGVAACANLDVVNPNAADTGRVLSTPGDVESLISGAFNTWFQGNYYYYGPGLFMSNQSFQHAAPWANAGMYDYGKIPRAGIVNDASDSNYDYWTYPWYHMYRAIAAVASGLQSLDNPDVASALPASDVLRDQAFGYFILGMGHSSLAILYDQAFIIDETTDVSQPQTASPYTDVMSAAMGYFDKALQLCSQGSFTIPVSWAETDGLTNTYLAQIIHSEKARYMAAIARTPAERKALDWTAIMQNIDQGITETYAPFMDGANNNWLQGTLWLANWGGWGESPYWMYGMADQSGNYQRWLDQPVANKLPNPADGDIVIVTPDQRFPQGTTIAEQQDNPGTNLMAMSEDDAHGVWAHPERGQWRWSWYHNDEYDAYEGSFMGNIPEIPMSEMNLLKAEGLYYKGDMAGAAALINITRTAAGLNATDASGTNTSCVPKVPNGDGTSASHCGNLWEMLKWEKRIEDAFLGLYGVPWYFDSRGWGDLWAGTQLEFPVPCKELQTLQILPCYTFGGQGGDQVSGVSTYHFPGEG